MNKLGDSIVRCVSMRGIVRQSEKQSEYVHVPFRLRETVKHSDTVKSNNSCRARRVV